MSSPLLELVELSDGEIVLRRHGAEGEPLLTLRFSDEAKEQFGIQHLELARLMVAAGVAALSAIDREGEADAEPEPVVLH